MIEVKDKAVEFTANDIQVVFAVNEIK